VIFRFSGPVSQIVDVVNNSFYCFVGDFFNMDKIFSSDISFALKPNLITLSYIVDLGYSMISLAHNCHGYFSNASLRDLIIVNFCPNSHLRSGSYLVWTRTPNGLLIYSLNK